LILFILIFSYRQIWLNSNVVDHQFGYITKLKKKKVLGPFPFRPPKKRERRSPLPQVHQKNEVPAILICPTFAVFSAKSLLLRHNTRERERDTHTHTHKRKDSETDTGRDRETETQVEIEKWGSSNSKKVRWLWRRM
jgi:hypothetical protein